MKSQRPNPHRVRGEDRGAAARPLLPLTPPLIRALAKRSQVYVAAMAGTSVATVRLYEETEGRSPRDPLKRRAIARVYVALRDELLVTPAA